MFWDKYVALCNEVKKSPNAVAKEIGISSGAVSGKLATSRKLPNCLKLPTTSVSLSPTSLMSSEKQKKPRL